MNAREYLEILHISELRKAILEDTLEKIKKEGQ